MNSVPFSILYVWKISDAGAFEFAQKVKGEFQEIRFSNNTHQFSLINNWQAAVLVVEQDLRSILEGSILGDRSDIGSHDFADGDAGVDFLLGLRVEICQL